MGEAQTILVIEDGDLFTDAASESWLDVPAQSQKGL